MDWDGAIRAIKPFGRDGGFIVYGDGGVTLMKPFLEPAPGFSKTELLPDIGIHPSGAVDGTTEEHVFLAKTGDFYRITNEGIQRIPCSGTLPRIVYAAQTAPAGWHSHPLSEPIFNLRLHEYGNWLDFGDPPGCYVGHNNGLMQTYLLPASVYTANDPFTHSPSGTISEDSKHASGDLVARTDDYFEVLTGVYAQVDDAWNESVVITSSYRLATSQAGLGGEDWVDAVKNSSPGYIGGSYDGGIDEFFNLVYKLPFASWQGYWLQFKWTITATISGTTSTVSVESVAVHLSGDLPSVPPVEPEEGDEIIPVPDAPIITGSITAANYLLISRDALYNTYYITWKNAETSNTIAYVLNKLGVSACDLQEDLITVVRHRSALVGVYSAYKTVRYTIVLNTFPIDFGTQQYKTITGIEVGASFVDAHGVDTTPGGLLMAVEVTMYDANGNVAIVTVAPRSLNRGVIQQLFHGVRFGLKITLYDQTNYTGEYTDANLHIDHIRIFYHADDHRVSRGYNPANAG